MNRVRPGRVGLVLAVLLGLWHAAWAFLVMVRWAQPLIDFVFRLHFIRPVYVIEDFSAGIALALIAFTALIGYVMGWVFGVLWNVLHTE